MNKLIILCIASIAFVAAVGAQLTENTGKAASSDEWRAAGQTCQAMVIEEYRAATNQEQTLEEQEKHLNAAKAYRELQLEGFQC